MFRSNKQMYTCVCSIWSAFALELVRAGDKASDIGHNKDWQIDVRSDILSFIVFYSQYWFVLSITMIAGHKCGDNTLITSIDRPSEKASWTRQLISTGRIIGGGGGGWEQSIIECWPQKTNKIDLSCSNKQKIWCLEAAAFSWVNENGS